MATFWQGKLLDIDTTSTDLTAADAELQGDVHGDNRGVMIRGGAKGVDPVLNAGCDLAGFPVCWNGHIVSPGLAPASSLLKGPPRAVVVGFTSCRTPGPGRLRRPQLHCNRHIEW